MASDKLDIIISMQRDQSAQLAALISKSGEHTADIRALHAGLQRLEQKVECRPPQAIQVDDSTAGEVAAAVGVSRKTVKLVVLVVSAIATAVATILGTSIAS
jgi:hypothetical protein